MRFVCLQLSKDGRYTKEAHTDCIILLADWLIDDVGDFMFWYDWLDNQNKESTFIGCNSSWLNKDNNVVTMGSIGDIVIYEHKDLQTPENHKINLSVGNTMELLISWENMLKAKPEQIMIYEEGVIYRMKEVQE